MRGQNNHLNSDKKYDWENVATKPVFSDTKVIHCRQNLEGLFLQWLKSYGNEE
jgi:hypothetical protein